MMFLRVLALTAVVLAFAGVAVDAKHHELVMGSHMFTSKLATDARNGLLSGAGVVKMATPEPKHVETEDEVNHEQEKHAAALSAISEDDATVSSETVPQDSDEGEAALEVGAKTERRRRRHSFREPKDYRDAMRLLRKEKGFKRVLKRKMKAVEKHFKEGTAVRNSKHIVEHLVQQALSQNSVGPSVAKATKQALHKIEQSARRTISFVARNSVPNMFPKDEDYQLCMKRITNWADVGPPQLRADVLLEDSVTDILLSEESDDEYDRYGSSSVVKKPKKKAKKPKKTKTVPDRFSFDATPAALAAIRTYATKCTYDRYARIAARRVVWWKTQAKEYDRLMRRARNHFRRHKYRLGRIKAVWQYRAWKRRLRKYVRKSSFFSRQAARMDVQLRTEQDARLRQDYNTAEVKVAKEFKDDINPDGTLRVPKNKHVAKRYHKQLGNLFQSEVKRLAKEKFNKLVAHFMQHHLLAGDDGKPHYDFPNDENVSNSRMFVGIGGAESVHNNEADYNPEPRTNGDPIVSEPKPTTNFKNSAEAEGIENLRFKKPVAGSKYNPRPYANTKPKA